jgi:4-hydroxy-tetrahydrodipicolinate synthase
VSATSAQAPILEGIWAALPTPFDDGGRIDQKAVDHLVDYLAAREIAGLALLTEAAEDPLLLPEERRALISQIGARAKGKKPFLVAISAPATREAVELAKLAHAKGASGLLLSTYRLPGLGYRELYRHLEKVSKATELPVFLVIRQDNAFDMLAPEELGTLAKHPSLRGVFAPSAPPSAIETWVRRFKGRPSAIFAGCSLAHSASAVAGASGVICGVAVVAPAHATKLYDAIKRLHADVVVRLEKLFSPSVEMLGPPKSFETMDSVQRLAARLAKRPLEGYQLQSTVPFALIKETLRLQGHPVRNRVRPPYEQVSADVSERLKTALKLSEIIS